MPHGLHPDEFLPVEVRRKKYIQQGGLGGPMDGRKSHHDIRQYMCANCHKTYQWTNDLDFTDFGDVIDNLCGDCRKILRTMRTNHPEMK